MVLEFPLVVAIIAALVGWMGVLILSSAFWSTCHCGIEFTHHHCASAYSD